MSLHMLFFPSVWISFMISFLALSSFTSHSSFCSISNSHLMLFSLPVTLVELDFWHQNSQWPKSRSLYLPSQHLILLSLQLICMRVSDWKCCKSFITTISSSDSNPELTPTSQKTYRIVMTDLICPWVQLHLEMNPFLSGHKVFFTPENWAFQRWEKFVFWNKMTSSWSGSKIMKPPFWCL